VCADVDIEFIEHGLSMARETQDIVDRELGEKYGDERVTYTEILSLVDRTIEDDMLLCGVPRVDDDSGEDAVAGTVDSEGFIYINTDEWGGGSQWIRARDGWQEGAYYGDLTEVEIVDLVSEADLQGFWDLKDAAHGWLFDGGFSAYLVTHEAAHYATGLLHSYVEHVEDQETAYDDYVQDVSDITLDTIYWEIWVPEKDWLNETYWSAH